MASDLFLRDSEALWTHAVACTSQNEQAHSLLGIALVERGDFAGAMAHQQAALEIYGDSELAHFGLANALVGRGRVDEAIVHYRAALKLKPNYCDAHHNLGLALASCGQLEEAIVHYRKALDLRPGGADTRYNLGLALANCGQFDEAFAYLQPALETRRDDAELHSALGNVLAARGQFSEAVVHYRKALQLRPDDSATEKNLAWLRATCPVGTLRNGNEALELAERANRRCDGKRADVLDALAAAYAELGWFPEALATARQALALSSRQHNSAFAAALRVRMALYEAGKPFHQTPATHK